MRVLVVEDHKELAATIAVGLRREGMAVDIAHDGQAALLAGLLGSGHGELFFLVVEIVVVVFDGVVLGGGAQGLGTRAAV